MKNRLKLLVWLFALSGPLAAQSVSVNGPDGKLQLTVSCPSANGEVSYAVTYNGKQMLESSPLGMETNVGDFYRGLQLKEHKVTALDTVYEQSRSTEPEKNQSQIYLYNYVHYDMLYRYRHAVNISRTDRYRVFNMGEIRTFSVKLTGLEPGKYCLRLYKVTKEHGSSYDAWVRMGAPERMNRMERAMLCHSADPEYRVWEQETDPEGSLTVQERLEPHETALIEVEQIL